MRISVIALLFIVLAGCKEKRVDQESYVELIQGYWALEVYADQGKTVMYNTSYTGEYTRYNFKSDKSFEKVIKTRDTIVYGKGEWKVKEGGKLSLEGKVYSISSSGMGGITLFNGNDIANHLSLKRIEDMDYGLLD